MSSQTDVQEETMKRVFWMKRKGENYETCNFIKYYVNEGSCERWEGNMRKLHTFWKLYKLHFPITFHRKNFHVHSSQLAVYICCNICTNVFNFSKCFLVPSNQPKKEEQFFCDKTGLWIFLNDIFTFIPFRIFSDKYHIFLISLTEIFPIYCMQHTVAKSSI